MADDDADQDQENSGFQPFKPEFEESQRGGQILVDTENYRYWRNRKRGNKEYFNCVESNKDSKCKVKLIYDSEKDLVLSISGEHDSHDSNLIENVVKQVTRTAVKRSLDSKPRDVLSQLSADIEENVGAVGTSLLPSQQAIAKQIGRNKKKENPLPLDPKGWDEFPDVIPIELSQSNRGEDFVICNEILTEENGNPRILGFGSASMIDVLKRSPRWLADGQFSICNSNLCCQVYTILCLTPQDKIVPAIQFLLPSKKKSVYEKMFRVVKDLIPIGPTILHVDFELAVTSAFQDVYPGSMISFCHFHWTQALERNLKSIGLKKEVNQRPDLQCFIRSFWTIIFLPPEDFGSAVDKLTEDIPYQDLGDGDGDAEAMEIYNRKIDQFIKYFVDNFVGEKTETGQRKDPRFPRASLSKFNEILEDRFCPLDNNAAESFNKNFAAPLPQSPSIWKIISQFKKEEALAQYKILQSVNGAQGSQDNAGRKNNMRKQRDEIHKILINYKQNQIPLETCVLMLMKYRGSKCFV